MAERRAPEAPCLSAGSVFVRGCGATLWFRSRPSGHCRRFLRVRLQKRPPAPLHAACGTVATRLFPSKGGGRLIRCPAASFCGKKRCSCPEAARRRLRQAVFLLVRRCGGRAGQECGQNKAGSCPGRRRAWAAHGGRGRGRLPGPRFSGQKKRTEEAEREARRVAGGRVPPGARPRRQAVRFKPDRRARWPDGLPRRCRRGQRPARRQGRPGTDGRWPGDPAAQGGPAPS